MTYNEICSLPVLEQVRPRTFKNYQVRISGYYYYGIAYELFRAQYKDAWIYQLSFTTGSSGEFFIYYFNTIMDGGDERANVMRVALGI